MEDSISSDAALLFTWVPERLRIAMTTGTTITQVKSTGMVQLGYFKDSESETIWESNSPIDMEEFRTLLGKHYDNWMFPYYLKGISQIDECHFAASIGQYYLD